MRNGPKLGSDRIRYANPIQKATDTVGSERLGFSFPSAIKSGFS